MVYRTSDLTDLIYLTRVGGRIRRYSVAGQVTHDIHSAAQGRTRCLHDKAKAVDVNEQVSHREPPPQPLPLHLKHWDDRNEESSHNPGFSTEGLKGAILGDPIDLKVSDHETTETANQVQQGGYFPLPGRWHQCPRNVAYGPK